MSCAVSWYTKNNFIKISGIIEASLVFKGVDSRAILCFLSEHCTYGNLQIEITADICWRENTFMNYIPNQSYKSFKWKNICLISAFNGFKGLMFNYSNSVLSLCWCFIGICVLLFLKVGSDCFLSLCNQKAYLFGIGLMKQSINKQ